MIGVKPYESAGVSLLIRQLRRRHVLSGGTQGFDVALNCEMRPNLARDLARQDRRSELISSRCNPILGELANRRIDSRFKLEVAMKTSRAFPKFESYAAFETATFCGLKSKAVTERFYGIGRLVDFCHLFFP